MTQRKAPRRRRGEVEIVETRELNERIQLERALANSPKCARTEPEACGHELAYHDPCSRCACPNFVEAATVQP